MIKHSQSLAKAVRRNRDVFADGVDVEPEKIRPRLQLVETERDSEIFRLARSSWSLPFTKGFGRRLRFLIWDEHNNKLIGILGFQSPPIDLNARDRLFKYPPGQKTYLINQTMDIYTLGALPPYSVLLGGKLVAYLAASNEVRQHYKSKYESTASLMQQRMIPSGLVCLTTTSAFGRSSLYNRLKYREELVARPIGYTQGFGTLHLSDFYDQVREYAETVGISSRGGYGVGPRIRWQVVSRVLKSLGLQGRFLKHGVRRQVFLYPLIDNLESYMAGDSKEPVYKNMPAKDLVDFWRDRWLLPRTSRVNHWPHWSKDEMLNNLLSTSQDDG